MLLTKKLMIAVAALALMIVSSSNSHAGFATPTVTLQSLLGGGTLLVGDKLFSNFQYTATGTMPTAANVNVTGITLNGNFGIEIQGAFHDLNGTGSDALLTYTVHVTNPNFEISDAHIQGNPTVVGGTGSMSVVETFLPLTNRMTIYDNVLSSSTSTQLSDSTLFSPTVSTLTVQKDILATSGTGLASLSLIDQTYSQVQVPEPGTLALLGIGGLGLVGYGWRRRKAKKS